MLNFLKEQLAVKNSDAGIEDSHEVVNMEADGGNIDKNVDEAPKASSSSNDGSNHGAKKEAADTCLDSTTIEIEMKQESSPNVKLKQNPALSNQQLQSQDAKNSLSQGKDEGNGVERKRTNISLQNENRQVIGRKYDKVYEPAIAAAETSAILGQASSISTDVNQNRVEHVICKKEDDAVMEHALKSGSDAIIDLTKEMKRKLDKNEMMVLQGDMKRIKSIVQDKSEQNKHLTSAVVPSFEKAYVGGKASSEDKFTGSNGEKDKCTTTTTATEVNNVSHEPLVDQKNDCKNENTLPKTPLTSVTSERKIDITKSSQASFLSVKNSKGESSSPAPAPVELTPKEKANNTTHSVPLQLWKEDDLQPLDHINLKALAENVQVDETFRSKPKIKLLLQRYKAAAKIGLKPELFAKRLTAVLGYDITNPNKIIRKEIVIAYKLFQNDLRRAEREAKKLSDTKVGAAPSPTVVGSNSILAVLDTKEISLESSEVNSIEAEDTKKVEPKEAAVDESKVTELKSTVSVQIADS